MANSGHATTIGTTRYRERFSGRAAPHHFRNQQSLWLSSIGIGTYLGNADEETDKNYGDAVTVAVELGSNVIDSAANYRFQRSERSIGRALQRLLESGFSRDELVICTKGGYLPFDGTPPKDLRAYIEETFVNPGIAGFDDFVAGSHCMTPRYLGNQLDQSLTNMRIDCVDVYYIHNPESQLPYVSGDEFESRLRAAFESLEQNRQMGKLICYGVATWNGFRATATSREFHSLTRMVDLAREVGGESHGFRFIQLPFNLAMPEALTLPNHTLAGQQLSLLETAAALDVTVMASASMLQGKVARGLPETIRTPLGSLKTDAQTAIQFVRSTPGVTTSLVGMSKRAHVEENLQLVGIDPVSPEKFLQLFNES